jgi:cupin 2 domain-containing protein
MSGWANEPGIQPQEGTKGAAVMGTLFGGIPADLSMELIETIGSAGRVRIERIVSRGHASPQGFWYDQEGHEFVLIVQGSAGLKIGEQKDILVLKTGDYLNIPSHVRHRVEWTDPTCDTIWLAVHC